MPPKSAEVARKLRRAGFKDMPGKGAHMKFFHPDGRFTVVPLHPGEVSFGVFRKILKQVRMTEDEYRKL